MQTGFARLGKWFWGFELHDTLPDNVILGKPMGNSHPIAAVVTTVDVADSFANGMEFFSSFDGNPVSCAVAKAVLEIIEVEKLQHNSLQVGDYFKQQLKEMRSCFDGIGDVRGEGLFLGIEMIDKQGNPDAAMAANTKNELKNKFILTGADGPDNNIIKIKPPICFSHQNVNTFMDTFQQIIKRK